MAEDEHVTMEVARRELGRIMDEVQEIKMELLTQEDETPYELLDGGELEDLEADLGALLTRGQTFRNKIATNEVDEGTKMDDSKNWKAFQKTTRMR